MKRTKDFITPSIFILFSIICLTTVTSMNAISLGFPLVILILTLIFSIVLLIVTIVGKEPQDKGVIFTSKTTVTSISLLLYLLSIWIMGFFMSSLLYTAFLTWYLQGKDTTSRTRIFRAIMGATVTTTVLYVTFRYGLSVYLPSGLLFS